MPGNPVCVGNGLHVSCSSVAGLGIWGACLPSLPWPLLPGVLAMLGLMAPLLVVFPVQEQNPGLGRKADTHPLRLLLVLCDSEPSLLGLLHSD